MEENCDWNFCKQKEFKHFWVENHCVEYRSLNMDRSIFDQILEHKLVKTYGVFFDRRRKFFRIEGEFVYENAGSVRTALCVDVFYWL